MTDASCQGISGLLGEPLVWGGRFADQAPDGADRRDGWSLAGADLRAALDRAGSLTVLDPLSFPWRELSAKHRELPLVVRLPDDLDYDDLVALLGDPLLRHVTDADALVLDDAGLRDRLARDYDLDPQVWHSSQEDWRRAFPDPVRAVRSKAHHYEVARIVADHLSDLVATSSVPPTIATLGRAGSLNHQLGRRLRHPVASYPLDPADDEIFRPTPHAAVVWLADGGQSRAERERIARSAYDLLHPGGQLVLLGYPVTAPGCDPNPSISTLAEELADISGTLLHVHELRSLRFADDHISRGVLIGAASLSTGKI